MWLTGSSLLSPLSFSLSKGSDISFPSVAQKDSVVAAVPRRIYSNAHAYHINSISLNSDGETYISSDDLRINLWNLGISDQSFSMFYHPSFLFLPLALRFFPPNLVTLQNKSDIVDIKPANMEELTEVITSAEFHPKHCNLFMYSSRLFFFLTFRTFNISSYSCPKQQRNH